jgi:hypothetical protein
MAGIADITDYILNAEEVTVCRVKDRFTKSSDSGWADMMINFYLNDDNDQHVCEVQLIHFKMLSQRTTQQGHGAYNIFRAAAELLNHKKLTGPSSVLKLTGQSSGHSKNAIKNRRRQVVPLSLSVVQSIDKDNDNHNTTGSSTTSKR